MRMGLVTGAWTIACALFAGESLQAGIVDDTIVYQGRLLEAGQPVTDNCDFRVSLFDALTNGTQIGTTQQFLGVAGHSGSNAGRGVYGYASSNTGTNFGVYSQSDSTSGFDFYAAGAGTNYGSASSIRWKRNVEPIDDPLEMISQLRGVYFDWDAEHGGHHDIGMIAEEVGAFLPEIVNYEENGIDAIGMDYSKLTPLLVEAIKALREEGASRITQQEARIGALETDNGRLRAEVAELKALVEAMASAQEENH